MDKFKKAIDGAGVSLLLGLGIIIGYASGVHDGRKKAELECGVKYEYQSKTSSDTSD